MDDAMRIPSVQKASDQELIDSYKRTKSVWETGKEFGISGQHVHKRLRDLEMELDGRGKQWMPEDDVRLASEYEIYRHYGKVKELADDMGRTVYFLSRKARELGLTTTHYDRAPRASLKKLSEPALKMIWEEYKTSTFKMSEFCRRHGYDDETFSNIMKDRFYSEFDNVMESKMIKGTKYATGRSFEYRSKKHLEKAGFFVMRAPQSKGPVDLMAFDHGTCLFIQCKIGSWHRVDAWNEFYDLANKYGARPIFCTKKENGRIQFNLITGKKDRSRKPNPMYEIKIGETNEAKESDTRC